MFVLYVCKVNSSMNDRNIKMDGWMDGGGQNILLILQKTKHTGVYKTLAI
mgnify:FL=1